MGQALQQTVAAMGGGKTALAVARLGGQRTEASRGTCIVIIDLISGAEHHDVAVAVDAVSEVLEVSGANIEPPQ